VRLNLSCRSLNSVADAFDLLPPELKLFTSNKYSFSLWGLNKEPSKRLLANVSSKSISCHSFTNLAVVCP